MALDFTYSKDCKIDQKMGRPGNSTKGSVSLEYFKVNIEKDNIISHAVEQEAIVSTGSKSRNFLRTPRSQKSTKRLVTFIY